LIFFFISVISFGSVGDPLVKRWKWRCL